MVSTAPPPLISTMKSSVFTHVHSSLLFLVDRLHQCCTNCSYHINNGSTFSGQALYISKQKWGVVHHSLANSRSRGFVKKERTHLFKSCTFCKNDRLLPQSPSPPKYSEKNNPAAFYQTNLSLQREFLLPFKTAFFGKLQDAAELSSKLLCFFLHHRQASGSFLESACS